MHVPFFVDDNTGRVLVDPRGADLDLHRDFEQEFCDSFFTTKEPAPGNVRSFLARHGIVTSNKIKVEEYCIKPKNSLFILGTLGENPGIEVGPQPVQDSEPFDPISSQWILLVACLLVSLRHASDEDFDIDFDSPSRSQRCLRRSRQSFNSLPDVARRRPDMTQQQKVAAALMKAGISNPAAWTAAGMPSAGASGGAGHGRPGGWAWREQWL